ncbi:MAG: hypothetical protein HY093_00755 [Candidatus Liptonbacteria bacterium]|nr:hypothetical protein [Candidatus Liptonbacteria bacterium]
MEINDQKLEQILTKQAQDFQRYLGVAIESFESQVKLIAESMVGMERQLTAIKDMVARNTEDIEEMKINIRINTEDISEVKENVSIIRSDLKVKTAHDEFALLERRVVKLEKTVSHKN